VALPYRGKLCAELIPARVFGMRILVSQENTALNGQVDLFGLNRNVGSLRRASALGFKGNIHLRSASKPGDLKLDGRVVTTLGPQIASQITDDVPDALGATKNFQAESQLEQLREVLDVGRRPQHFVRD